MRTSIIMPEMSETGDDSIFTPWLMSSVSERYIVLTLLTFGCVKANVPVSHWQIQGARGLMYLSHSGIYGARGLMYLSHCGIDGTRGLIMYLSHSDIGGGRGLGV